MDDRRAWHVDKARDERIEGMQRTGRQNGSVVRTSVWMRSRTGLFLIFLLLTVDFFCVYN